MNIIGRLLRYITGNIKHSILIFLTLFVSGTFVCGSYVIQEAVGNIQNQFINKTGPHLFPVYQLEDDIKNSMLWSKENRNKRNTYVFYRTVLEKYFNDSRVKSYSYSLYKYVYTDKLHEDVTDWSYLVSEAQYYNELKLYGIKSPVFNDLKTNDVIPVDGRLLSDAEINNGEKVCLISEDLCMDDNGVKRFISIGDYIPVSLIYFDTDNGLFSTMKDKLLADYTISLKVVGKYTLNNTDISDNRIFVPNHLIEQLDNISMEMEASYNIVKDSSYESLNTNCIAITDVDIELRDISDVIDMSLEMSTDLWDLNHAISNLGEDGLPKEEYLKIIKSTDLFANYSWITDELDSLTDYLQVISVVTFLAILSIMVYIIIKRRTIEIGVLLSLGENKKSIIIQLTSEIFILSLSATLLSILTGTAIAKPIGNLMMENTVKEESVSHSTDQYGNRIEKLLELNNDNIEEMMQIKLDNAAIIKTVITENLIAILSMSLSLLYILKLKPKQILLN